jgi:hypothetical protein
VSDEATTQETIEEVTWELSLKLIDKRVELAKHRHDLFYPWGRCHTELCVKGKVVEEHLQR